MGLGRIVVGVFFCCCCFFSNSILNFISLPWGNVTQLCYPFLLPRFFAVQCLWSTQIKIKRPLLIIQQNHKCCWRWIWLIWVLWVTSEWIRIFFQGKYIGFVHFYFSCLENSGGPDWFKINGNGIKKKGKALNFCMLQFNVLDYELCHIMCFPKSRISSTFLFLLILVGVIFYHRNSKTRFPFVQSILGWAKNKIRCFLLSWTNGDS